MRAQRLHLSLFFCLVLGVCLAIPLLTFGQENADLIERQAQLKTKQEALDGIEDKALREELEKQVEHLQEEVRRLDLETRKEAIEAKEAVLSKELRGHTRYNLREALRAIDSDMETPTRLSRNLDRDIRLLRARRAATEERRFGLSSDPAGREEEIAELDQEILNKDAEILAKAIQRDRADLQVSVSENANRIDEMIRNLPINPRPTIRLLLDRNRQIDAESKKAEDMTTLLALLQTQREESEAALSLTVEKKDLVDKSDSTSLNKKLRKLLREKLQFHQQQVDEVDQGLLLARQARELYEREAAFLEEELGALTSRYWKSLLFPVAAIAVIVLGNLFISRMVLPRLYEKDNLFIARRLGSYLVLMLIIFVLASFFLEDLKAIATVMGIAGAAIVIALQDLCSSFAGWFVIIASRKFQVGNRVEIDEHRGDVIDIQLLRTTLLELHNWLGVDEPTGRVIIVPNSFIFKSKVINYSHVHPYIWGRIDVTVTFETPAQEAHDLLRQILEEETKEEFEAARHAPDSMAERYGVPDTRYEPKIYSIIADSGVTFSLLYVCHYRNFATVRTKINKRIIAEFDARPQVNFAYPTERHIPTPDGPSFPVNVTRS